MNGKLLAYSMIRLASFLAPAGRRAAWLEEWRSELWYVSPEASARFSLGAFRDALWVRRHQPRHVLLESPLACLAFLAGVAMLAFLTAVCLPSPEIPAPGAHLRPRDFPGLSVAMLAMSLMFLAGIRAAMGPARYRTRPGRVRRAVFLTLKLALVQPVVVTSFLMMLLTGHVVPIAGQVLFSATWALTLRWIVLDQRRRCPVCLRLLTEPVRIGSASETFLEWYGAESACSRGHGLLQVPETHSTYAGARRWLALDASWKDLFSEAAERR